MTTNGTGTNKDHATIYWKHDKSEDGDSTTVRIANFLRWAAGRKETHGIYFTYLDIARAYGHKSKPTASDAKGVKNTMGSVKRHLDEVHSVGLISGGPGIGYRACYDHIDECSTALPASQKRVESAEKSRAKIIGHIDPAKLDATTKRYFHAVVSHKALTDGFDFDNLKRLQAAAVKPKAP